MQLIIEGKVDRAGINIGGGRRVEVCAGVKVWFEERPGWSKPNISLDFERLTAQLEGGNFTFDKLTFEDNFALAGEDEVEKWERLSGPEDYLTIAYIAGVEIPTKETVRVAVKGMDVVLTEGCEFGAFMDGMLDFKSALFKGLKEAEISKTGRGGYQLLDISVRVDGSFTVSDLEKDKRVPRFVLALLGAEISIRRNQAPSRTQTQLNQLDTSEAVWSYGNPMFGYMKAKVESLKFSVYPLEDDHPLVGAENLRVAGYLYVAPLVAGTQGLPRARKKVRPIHLS